MYSQAHMCIREHTVSKLFVYSKYDIVKSLIFILSKLDFCVMFVCLSVVCLFTQGFCVNDR